MYLKFPRPLILASFGNLDLLTQINEFLEFKRNRGLDLTDRFRLVRELTDKFYNVLTPLMMLEESLRARKEWILENSRCCEVLDSEFFY